MARSGLAEGRVLRGTHSGSDPDAPLLVEQPSSKNDRAKKNASGQAKIAELAIVLRPVFLVLVLSS
jgi:hypothetical protein